MFNAMDSRTSSLWESFTESVLSTSTIVLSHWRSQLRGLVFALLALSCAVSASANQWGPGQIAGIETSPGTVASGKLVIEPLGDDSGTFIPITIVRGQHSGPTMSLIAGVHGSEYAPILALQALRAQLDPTSLRGTVVLVHAANVPAFEGRTIYFGPVDRKNLNRSFPGKAEGTLTERIAHALTEGVIRESDFVMDIHSGDGNEGLRPSYTGYYAEAGSPEVISKSREMALAFGLDTIVEFRGDLTRETAIWCGSAAVALGIPSLDVESGERGRTETQYVDPIVNGVLSVLRHFEMLPGQPAPTKSPFFVKERGYAKSQATGIWYPDPRVQPGDYVTEGALLGRVTDWFGTVIQEVRAPASGALLILLESPPVNEGETIAVVAKVN